MSLSNYCSVSNEILFPPTQIIKLSRFSNLTIALVKQFIPLSPILLSFNINFNYFISSKLFRQLPIYLAPKSVILLNLKSKNKFIMLDYFYILWFNAYIPKSVILFPPSSSDKIYKLCVLFKLSAK